MEATDVAVVGAGSTGTVATHLLARAGRSVLLLDPRLAGGALLKPGDALSSAALRVLRASGLPLPSQSPGTGPSAAT
jgi:2-polyprenyl-6-methoxyphenol hydroxylase-like FAD-dependent oxidoreductase